MPAAPAGRALLPSRGRADLPCSDHATRRGFMLGSSALLASLLLPRSAPRAAPPPRSDACGRRRLLGVRRPACRTSSTATGTGTDVHARARDAQREHAAHPRRGGARGAHRPGAPRRPRPGAGRRAVQRAGVGRRARRPARQGHMPGWRDGLTGGGIQHLVVDTEIAWALMFAWQAREALGLDGDGGPDRRPHHPHRRRRSSGAGRRCG